MQKNNFLESLEELKSKTKKRNFSQTLDLIITLRDINLKKPENHREFLVDLPHGLGKDRKICCFVSVENKDEASKYCDFIITDADLESYRGKKREVKKLVRQYDWFVADAKLMPKIAGVFGRALGPLGKMPSPKHGTIIANVAQLKTLIERLKRSVKVSIKKQPQVQIPIGLETQDPEKLADNFERAFKQIVEKLPNEQANVKRVYIKYTMSPTVEVKVK